MSRERRVATQLELASQDVEAALLLAKHSNRYAAFHCQQAAEKLIKALLDLHGIEYGGEHHLDVLVDKLPDSEEWKARLRVLERLSPYATSFRYAKPGGGLMPAPSSATSTDDAHEIEALISEVRAELRIVRSPIRT